MRYLIHPPFLLCIMGTVYSTEWTTIKGDIMNDSSSIALLNTSSYTTTANPKPTSFQTNTFELSTLSTEPKSSSGKIIGLSIGLPIGIFCFALFVFLFYFYFVKNNLLTMNPPISPDMSVKSTKNTWFSDIFGANYHVSDDIEKNNRDNILLPNEDLITSKIRYNISKPIPKHILTPRSTYNSSSKEVDQILYSNPPNIFHIGSTLPSTANLDGKSPVNKISRSNWKYNSPLSRWFLRGSTYYRERNQTSPALVDSAPKFTPGLRFKRLNILSSVEKKIVDYPEAYVDEKSPMLGKSNSKDILNNPSSIPNTGNVSFGSNGSTSSTSSLNKYLKKEVEATPIISPQIISIPVSENWKSKVCLGSVPTKKSHNIKYNKELPSLPESGTGKNNIDLEVGKIYEVATEYNPKLADEIKIEVGEYVRMVVTHNDGWCLVEKCTQDGTTKSILDARLFNTVDGERKYLNDERGIIPGDCLRKRV